MSASIKWDGLDALITQLTNAPKEIRDDGLGIVREETTGAADDIRTEYPDVTGRMKRGVKTDFPSSTILVGVVKSTDPAAHLYEFGTQRRSFRGANRGSVRPHPVTVPVARRRRRRMYERLSDMLTRMGFQVSGGN